MAAAPFPVTHSDFLFIYLKQDPGFKRFLEKLSKKFQFNLNFEGGEAETFVVNCPFFQKSVKIINSQKIWDGYRGRFEIVDAELENNA